MNFILLYDIMLLHAGKTESVIYDFLKIPFFDEWQFCFCIHSGFRCLVKQYSILQSISSNLPIF